MSLTPRPAGLLGDLAGPEVLATMSEGRVLLQPIGAFEHHGPHLPLCTDSLVIDAVAQAVVADHPELEVSLLPTLSYGLSSEHVWAPGTVTMSVTTLLAVLDDVATGAVRAGAERLALLNGHGGNTHLLRVACREIRARHGLATFL
ncbi:MAG: creatininase family protein, partial [Acidimicrobiaceae bacterium]|nr:creatininase family protein [Acidimicrobiaceae bacterium]